MSRRMCSLAVLAIAGALLGAPRSGRAQVPAFTVTTGTEIPSGGSGTAGYTFVVNSPIVVTELGFYDAGLNGLFDSHEVGIFDLTGGLIVSGTVDAGTVDPLVDQFRYTPVTPTLLTPGTYLIGAFYPAGTTNSDYADIGAPSVIPDPRIAYGSSAVLAGPAFAPPLPPLPATAATVFGPNFLITSPSVPEPSSLAFLATSVMSSAGLLLRRRRRA